MGIGKKRGNYRGCEVKEMDERYESLKASRRWLEKRGKSDKQKQRLVDVKKQLKEYEMEKPTLKKIKKTRQPQPSTFREVVERRFKSIPKPRGANPGDILFGTSKKTKRLRFL